MRLLAIAACLAVPATAHADSFLEFGGGIAIPLGDSDWTNYVESSPKLAVRAGAVQKAVGGMVSIDWTPENTDTTSGTFPGGSTDVSAYRFRLLAQVVFRHRVRPKIELAGRAGAGLDIAHGGYTISSVLGTATASDTDTGFGFELAGGVWFDVGKVQVGGELGLPIGVHSHQAKNTMDIKLDYTSYDLDFLFGVRLHSR